MFENQLAMWLKINYNHNSCSLLYIYIYIYALRMIQITLLSELVTARAGKAGVILGQVVIA